MADVPNLPWFIFGAYVVMSFVAFIAYAQDKAAAVRGQWRTSEATLLACGLLCGWPGALAAQRLFRHKTRKQPFRTLFWVSVIMNVVALIGFAVLLYSQST